MKTEVEKVPRLRHMPTYLSIVLTALLLIFSVSSFAEQHDIKLVAEELDGGYLAYRMMQHEVTDESSGVTDDITGRYNQGATIPGPTIVINEGDTVDIELFHAIDPDSPGQEHVSLHVHGVHYDILSDGTLKYVNMFKDESATPVMSYIYRWDAEPGTAGTWAYHDHNFNTHNGAEDRGLYGALVVNPKVGTVPVISGNGQQQAQSIDGIDKEYILYLIDDAIAGMEIDNSNDHAQTWLGVNPLLSARRNTPVRIHLIALGTNVHNFSLPNYSWVDPGTRNIISQKAIGPLEKHVFAIQATQNAQYQDETLFGRLLGMRGSLQISE